ncbi:MAG: hypothetical protein U0903_14945 [Planctomycetales bacterium]
MFGPQSRRKFLNHSLLLASSGTLLPRISYADLAPGVETRVLPNVSEQELSSQVDFWELEVLLKPLRMIYVNMPDPGNPGKTQKRLVWYQCYRALNRPIVRPMTKESTPLAGKDPLERPPVFVPEFTLVTDDNNSQNRYIDRVMPLAQAAINARELRGGSKVRYKNSVEIVGPLPPPVPEKTRPKDEDYLWGVATWRSVDPTTDKFRIFMTGFSSGYREITTPDGKTAVQRKTIVQEFWRPSDEFDQEEKEIRPVGPPKWIYR